MALVKSGEFSFLFPTLLLQRRLEEVDEMNRELKELILDLEGREAGITRANVGAWHSELSFLQQQHPAVERLRGHLRKAVTDYWAMDQQQDPSQALRTVRMVAWALVYRSGHYAVPHVHPNANFSGVYYVDAGGPSAEHPSSGVFTCIDPRVGAAGLATDGVRQGTTFEVRPETGLLVVFPAWLLHHAHPYFGERERIAVSFNVSIHRAAEVPA